MAEILESSGLKTTLKGIGVLHGTNFQFLPWERISGFFVQTEGIIVISLWPISHKQVISVQCNIMVVEATNNALLYLVGSMLAYARTK